MKVKKLSYEKFLKSLKLAPRLTVELVVEDREGRIALVRRLRPPFERHWHLPGGFLLKGEKLSECAGRLAMEELGITVGQGKFLGLFENINRDPRGHILHYVQKHKLSEKVNNPNVGWFKKLPNRIIPYQREFLNSLGYR